MRKAGKSYPVGLAGESNYQAAICVCREGEPVQICHEIGNPYDEDALVVVSVVAAVALLPILSVFGG